MQLPIIRSLVTSSLVLTLSLAVSCAPSDDAPGTDGGTQPEEEEEEEEQDQEDAGESDAGDEPGEPPTVTFAQPADGDVGVSPSVLPSVTFSRPMDITSVEGAFSTSSLPNLSFVWSDDRTILNIIPEGGLAVAEGDGLDPSAVDAVEYEFTFDTSAAAEDGVPLEEPFTVRFTTHKVMQATLAPVEGLSRTMLSTGVLHSGNNATLYVGDSEFSAATQMKTFLTFDFTDLPDGVEITAAEVVGQQTVINGAPYDSLGSIKLEHVSYTEVGPDSFAAAALADLGAFSTTADLEDKALGVLEAFRADYDARVERENRSQYRLAFPLPHDGDDEGDSAEFPRSSVGLRFTYLAE